MGKAVETFTEKHPIMTFLLASSAIAAVADIAISLVTGRNAKKSNASPPVPTAKKITKTNDKSLERLPFVARRIEQVFPVASKTGRPIEPHEMQVLLSMAWLESGIANDAVDADGPKGSWWKGEMQGSGNLGALQCFKADLQHANGETTPPGYKPPPHYTCAMHGDKKQNADGSWTPYTTGFRFFIPTHKDEQGRPSTTGQPMTAAEAAAYEFVREVYVQRPSAGKAIAENKSVREIAEALRRENYHGSPINDYAKAIASHILDVANALGQKPKENALAVSGTFEKAKFDPITGKIYWYT